MQFPYLVQFILRLKVQTFHSERQLIVTGRAGLSMLSLATSSYLTGYPITLLVPCNLMLRQNSSKLSIAKSLVVFMTSLAGFLILSFDYVGNWGFLRSTYGCSLSVADLRPNVGLLWYLFIEMFDHFRSFFLIVFQFNMFIYCLPMSIKFRYRDYGNHLQTTYFTLLLEKVHFSCQFCYWQ